MEKAMVLNQIQQRLKPKESFFLDLSEDSSKSKDEPKIDLPSKPDVNAVSNPKPEKAQLTPATSKIQKPPSGPEDNKQESPVSEQGFSLVRVLSISSAALVFSLATGLLVDRIVNLVAAVITAAIVSLTILVGASVLGLWNQKPSSKSVQDEVGLGSKSTKTELITIAPEPTEQKSIAKATSKKTFAASKKKSKKQTSILEKQQSTESIKSSNASESETNKTPIVVEDLVAELAAEQESSTEQAITTYAPDKLAPSNALRQRRRKPGADLRGFKQMADEMFKR